MKKIFLTAITLIIFCVPLIVSAASSATEKLVQMEIDTYGSEQNGAILERINRLEKDYSGRNMRGNMNVRINSLYEILYQNKGTPSIFAKVNALEWNAYNEVSGNSLNNRIAKLESEILGKTSTSAFIKRIDALAKGSFGSAQIPLSEMQVSSGVLIKVELVESVDSRTLKVGDLVEIKVAEDVLINDKLIFAKGLRGKGIVESVRKANGWLVKNGKIDINFYSLDSIEGRDIDIHVGEESKNEMIRHEMVAGASLVKMNISNDWNKLMVHGKNIEAPAGTALYVQTKKTVSLYGLMIKSN